MPIEWANKIRGWIAKAAVRWEVIARSSGKAEEFAIDGRHEHEDGHLETWEDDATLAQHYGFRSRPGPRAEGFVAMARGEASQRVLIATRSRSDEPAELAEWEVDLFSRFKQRLHMDKDGRLVLTVDSGSEVLQDQHGAILLTSAEGATVELDRDGAILATSKGDAELALSKDDTTVGFTHPAGRGDAPSAAVVVGGALGAAPVLADGPNGTDVAFDVSVQADPMMAGAPGDVVEITFAKPLTREPQVFIQARNADAAAAGTVGGTWWYTATTTKITIKTTATLTAATTYRLSVWVIQ